MSLIPVRRPSLMLNTEVRAESDGAVVVITNGNNAWGGLMHADVGLQFIGLNT
eukprot:SAG11_NODE_4500_length_1874_cov_1.433239_2_plen_52_part_01